MAHPIPVTGAAGRVGAVGCTVVQLLLKQANRCARWCAISVRFSLCTKKEQSDSETVVGGRRPRQARCQAGDGKSLAHRFARDSA
jgi:hypothetical protein